jgi:hypothetical protein
MTRSLTSRIKQEKDRIRKEQLVGRFTVFFIRNKNPEGSYTNICSKIPFYLFTFYSNDIAITT